MTRDQILAWLKELGVKVPATQQRDRWVVCECPLGTWRHHGGQSAPDVCGVRIQPGESFVMCFACDFHDEQGGLLIELHRLEHLAPSGREYDWLKLNQLIQDAEDGAELLGLDSPDIEEMLAEKAKGPHQFPEWWLDTFVHWDLALPACSYLQNRGVDAEIAEKMDIRFDSKEGRVCFPVRDFSHKLRGLQGRAIKEGVEPRYRMYKQAGRNNPQYWLGEHWVDLGGTVIVVEGPFDVASVMRVYPNVVSPLFSNPSVEKIQRMSGAMDIVTFFDNGTGGDQGRAKFQKALGGKIGLYHAVPPAGKKDPGECSIQELEDTLHFLLA